VYRRPAPILSHCFPDVIERIESLPYGFQLLTNGRLVKEVEDDHEPGESLLKIDPILLTCPVRSEIVEVFVVVDVRKTSMSSPGALSV